MQMNDKWRKQSSGPYKYVKIWISVIRNMSGNQYVAVFIYTKCIK